MNGFASFSIAVACAALAAVCLALTLGRAKKLDSRAVQLFALFSLPLGVFCGHFLYFVAMAHMMIPEFGIGFAFAPWLGGFMFYGVAGGAVLAVLLSAKITGVRRRDLLDIAAPALMLLIAVIRAAEPLDGQGFGMDPEEALGPIALFKSFPFSYATDPDWPDFVNLAVCYFECLWALIILVTDLVGLKKRTAGQTALRTLVLYATGQIFFETLRRDYTVRWRFVRVSQLISALLLLGVLIVACRQGRLKGKRAVAHIAGLFLCVGAVIALEFAVDKPLKIPGLAPIYFSYVQVYSAILAMAVIMGLLTWYGNKAKEA